jgi:hypothetical protein
VIEKLSAIDRVKAVFWHCINPVFPHARDALLKFGIIKHGIRQPFVLGKLAPGRTVEGLAAHVAQYGFANHFIPWVDSDEVLGLRKRDDFHRQYHLRVFKDGEIRGHYEWTPESAPYWHLFEIGMEARREAFRTFLGDWLIETDDVR